MSNLQFFDIGKTELELERMVRGYEHNGWSVDHAPPQLLMHLRQVGVVISPAGTMYSLKTVVDNSARRLRMCDARDIELRDAADLMNVLYNLYGSAFFGHDPAKYVDLPR